MENRKKILFVATIASHIKSFHLPYLKMFQENGYKTYVAANWNLGENDKLDYCNEFIQIPIQRSPYSLKNLSAIKKLKQIINKEQFDIIHCHTPMGSVVARISSKKARKKYGTRVLYTAHGFHFFKNAPLKNWLFFYPIEWYLSKYTDTLITINSEDYNLARKKFKNRCNDIQYVSGVGIDLNKFKFNMSKKDIVEKKKSLGLKENDYVLSCIARLDKNKNQIFLINAMEELVKYNNNIHLILAGKDELNGYYRNITKTKGLDNNIHFLGNRSDVNELLKISNIVLSSSKREGLPVNVMEAFACGKPVIALECRGMKDLIPNDSFGYVVKQGDYASFIRYVKKLLENKKIRTNIENNNFVISKKYSIDNIINDYKKIYSLNNKIPKIIHYVWMGGKEKPSNIIKCMKSWSKLKNYEIREWNEKTFNINEHPFCKKAYDNKKWAFVSDYVRAWAIFNYGGIYFDTDILVVDGKRMDNMLQYDAFVGYESRLMPFTAVFGAIKKHPFLKKMLEHYNNNLDINTPNTQWVSDILKYDYKCKLGNIEQELKDGIHVFPKEILCEPSNKSVTIHAFTGTWVNKRSLFGKISTFLRVNSNYFICRIIYSKIIIPIKERKNEKVYNNNNSNVQ